MDKYFFMTLLRVHMSIDLLVNYFLYCLTCWLDICLLSFALWGDGKMEGKSNYEKCSKIAFCSGPWVSRKRLGPQMTCRTWIHINMYRRKAPMNNLWSRKGDEKDTAGSFKFVMTGWSFRDTEWHFPSTAELQIHAESMLVTVVTFFISPPFLTLSSEALWPHPHFNEKSQTL